MKAESADILQKLASEGHLRGIVLPKAKLRGINLANVDLSGAQLAHADLAGADLSSADLSGADLSGAILNEANLSQVRLEGANLAKARLRDANLTQAILTKTQLVRASLSGATLSGAHLSSSVATDADLSRVSAEDAVFSHTNLSRANLGACRLVHCDFSQANLDDTFLERATLLEPRLAGTSFVRAHLVGLTLERPGSLSGTSFKDADLAEAVLTGVSFEGADLAGTIFDQVTFNEVSFEGARLERTDFQGFKGLSESQIVDIRRAGAIVDALFIERIVDFVRAHRAAKVALGLFALAAVTGVFLYFSNPAFQPIDTLIKKAQDERNERQYERAHAIYDGLLERVKGRVNLEMAVLQEKAETYFEAEDYVASARLYDQIATLAGDDRDELVNARLKQLEALTEAGEFDEAVSIAKALEADPTNSPRDVARALLALSATYQKMGREEQALELFQETVARFPNDPEVAFDVNLQLAEVYLDRQLYKESQLLLERLGPMARDATQQVSLLILRARLFEGLGDREQSLQAFEELLKRYPQSQDVSPEVKMDLARLMADKGEFEWAGRVYAEIVSGAKDALLRNQARLAQASLLKQQGRLDEAIALFRQITKEAGNQSELRGLAKLEEADALAQAQRTQEAFEVLEEVMSSDEPGLAASGLLRKAQLLFSLSRLDEARAAYDELKAKYPAQSEVMVTARMDLARISMARGEVQSAINEWEALAKEPLEASFRTQILTDLGNAYTDLARPADAARVFALLQQSPDDLEARANAAFGMARLAAASGDRVTAASLYQSIANNKEDLTLAITALETMARMYEEANEVGKALEAYQEILSRLPAQHESAYQARLSMARIFESNGDSAQAEKLYLSLLEDAERRDVRAKTLLALGGLYLDRGEASKAFSTFAEVKTQFSNVPEAAFQAALGMAEAQRAEGKLEAAIRTLKALSEQTEDARLSLQALEALGRLYQQAGQAEEALKISQQMLTLAGQDQEALFNARLTMASSLREKGEAKKALEIYESLEKGVTDRNLRLTILDAKAQTYMALEQHDRAATAYETIVQQYRDNVDFYYNALMGLAGARRTQGRTAEAIALYEQVAKETTDSGMRVWALESVAQVYQETGQPELAKAALARTGKVARPADEDVVSRARALQAQGDTEGALAALRRELEQTKDEGAKAWALVAMGEILVEANRSSEASTRYLEVVEKYTSQAEPVLAARSGLAGISRASNKTMEAISRYEELAKGEAFPDYRMNAALTLAELYLEQKRYDKAKSWYETVVKRFPDKPEGAWEAELGLARLELINGQVATAISRLKPLEASAQAPSQKARMQALLVKAYVAGGDRAKAAATLEALKSGLPSEVDAVAEATAALAGN